MSDILHLLTGKYIEEKMDVAYFFHGYLIKT